VSRVLALALGVVLFHRLLAGAEVDLGVLAAPGCAAVLLFAAGAGLLTRGKRPYLSDGVAFALLLPLQGPLTDGVLGVLPGGAAATTLAALVSLGPAGFVLGRQLRPCGEAGVPALVLGVALGELLVSCGAAGWLPAWLAGAAAAALLAALAETAPSRDGHASDPPPFVEGLPALLLGAALGLLLCVLPRVAAAYATPTVRWTQDSALVLLLPAALVAWPAAVLAGEGRGRRWIGLLGGLALAWAAVQTLQHLALHENSMAQVFLSRKLHDRALRVAALLPAGVARAFSGHGQHLDAWAWLVVFSGLPAAATGVALGARRGADLGWFVLGAGLAAATPCALLLQPEGAPALLLLLAGALALVSAPVALLGMRGLLLLPLGVLPLLDLTGADPLAWRPLPGLQEVRRPGEYGLDASARTLPADVALSLASGRDIGAPEAERARDEAFTRRVAAFTLQPDGTPRANFEPEEHHAFGVEHEEAAPAEEPAAPEYSRGLRVAGVPQHARHPPTGPEGSVGRLTRLLARPGPAFVTGLGAELLAADLHDAGLADAIEVSSPVPLGRPLLSVLLEDLGLSGWQAGRVDEPAAAARAARAGGCASVLVAPAHGDLPGVAALLAEEHLARLAALLAPGGRCLVWLDTSFASEAALEARLAAFGAVFGARSAAFVEPRELDAPFVLLVGWRDETGAPSADELRARLPLPDGSGRRVRLSAPEDLSALLVRDGPGLQRLAGEGVPLSRARPRQGHGFADGGWSALAPLCEGGARLSLVVAGAADGPVPTPDLLAGLSLHASYEYEPLGLNSMLLEIKPDIEWARWDAEVACYERAARAQPGSPLLAHALAALLEPLAMVGDYGRFAQAFTRCGGAELPSWRLALQEWWVQKGSLEAEAAERAAERARRLAGPGPGP